ncbi:MAG: DUF4956 domain-containing protein [Lachnospiraceae bacterium]|nr:DUF4956 domain-containing protein [Lachnospiraceae bacterium]
MSFNDVFKSSFIESVTSFSVTDTLLGLAVALILGLFILLIYKKVFAGVMYSTGFAMSLVGLSLVTTLVIMAVTSNVVLSLGMVGALSIVRFRAAIKEPMEIVFLFWSLAVGIVVGAGIIPLAVIGSIIIGIILVIFASRKLDKTPYIMIVDCDNDNAENAAKALIEKSVDKLIVKSKTVNKSGIELTMEVRVKNGETSFVNRVNEVEGVSGATLVTFNGEYMS